MFINLLSYNVYLYNGYGNKYGKKSRDKTIQHNNILLTLKEIIYRNNINIVFLQEDIESLNDKTEEFFKSINFMQIKRYQSDNNKDGYTELINTIYISDSLVNICSNVSNKKLIDEDIFFGELNNCDTLYINRESLEKTYINNIKSYIGCKLDLFGESIIIVNTHLCGGKFNDDLFVELLNKYIIHKDDGLRIEIKNMINSKNKQLNKIYSDIYEKYKEYPTIIAGDFNCIHPTKFLPSQLNPELKKIYEKYIDNTEITNYIKSFVSKGHYLLNNLDYKTKISNKPTTPYNTVVDFIYYNENKLDLVSNDTIELLYNDNSNKIGLSDHNPIINSFRIKLKSNVAFYEYIHEKYKSDYLYNKTIKAFKNNIDIFKSHINIPYVDDDDINVKNIYNFMLTNCLEKDIRNILDNIFDKQTIKKEQLFISGFQPYEYTNILLNSESHLSTKSQTSSLLTDLLENLYNENIVQLKRYGITTTDLPNFDYSYKNKFNELFDFFDKNKQNKGTIYTTSFLNNDKNPLINSYKLTLSSKYFGNNFSQTKMLKVLFPFDDLEIYNLSGSTFTRRKLFKMTLTNILTNGKFDYNISNEELKNITSRQNYYDAPGIVDYSVKCKQILDEKILYTQNKDAVVIEPLCITGFWDGEKNIHEHIINHFINIYNKNNINNKHIIGYMGLDSGQDYELNETIKNSEIVWFSQELHLNNHALYFKNNIIYNNSDLYSTIYNFCKSHLDNIIKNAKIKITNATIAEITTGLNEFKFTIPEKFDIQNGQIIILDMFKNNFILDKTTDKDLFIEKYKTSNFENKVIVDTSIPEATLRGGQYYNKYLKYKKLYLSLKNKL